MALLATSYVTSAREARDILHALLEDNRAALGLGYIGKDNERRLPEYPAVVVSAGTKDKEFGGTHKFNVRLSCVIWVYHARMELSHAERSDQDIMLTEAIEALVEQDLTFNERFISSYITSMVPGMFQPAAAKGDLVVGSRLEWAALSQQLFK